MGPSDEPAKRRPTREQEELLARIPNPKQRRALIRAIENGEDIPSYAWTPVTEEIEKGVDAALKTLHQRMEDARARCQEEGTTFDELVEFDPEGTAEAIQDDDRLMELIARMKASGIDRSRLESVRPESESMPPQTDSDGMVDQSSECEHEDATGHHTLTSYDGGMTCLQCGVRVPWSELHALLEADPSSEDDPV